jgi:hypothetical protein
MTNADNLDAAGRLRIAFELSDMSIEIMRQNLRRQHPDLGDAEIQAKLQEWLWTRPGAELGDGEGVPRPLSSIGP